MRIAMVSEHASPLDPIGANAGGVSRYVAELAGRLAGRGHEVTVFTRRADPDSPARARLRAGVTVEHVPAGPPEYVHRDRLLPYVPEFGRYLAERWGQPDGRPDVVHAHFWMSGVAALAGVRGVDAPLEVPVVQTFHTLGAVEQRHQGASASPPERLRMESAVGRRVDRVLAACTDEVQELARMGVPRTSVSVVPCGVDIEHFTPTGPVAPRGARPRVIAVGRLVERKGFATVISALRGVPGAELVIVGGPDVDQLAGDPEAARLLAWADHHGVADRVRLVGRVDRAEMPALLRSADVMVAVPWYEPVGIASLEAMACGVPVVATTVGGLTDSVVDGVTGVLVPARRPDAVATELRKMITDPIRRTEYGVAGVDRARSRYSWDRVALDVERVYERALPANLDSVVAEGVR
jgi:glycosyltransferase involved in cell wall biosynthesis